MSKLEKILFQILQGTSDKNMPFKDLKSLMLALGFEERIKGSHHIYSKEGIIEIVNLQPKGSDSKAYQVKQVRQLVLKYKLGDLIK
jgi:predicted RNA binding protein YcfA (HicA-like mRNA interferase family)